MRMWAFVAIGLGLLPAGEPVGDGRDMQGSWRVVVLMDGGETQAVSPDSRVIITREKMMLKDKRYPFEFAYRLDSRKDPKWLDLVMPATEYPGIYELTGDTLKICYNERPRGERPSAFVSLANSPNDVLVVLRRDGR
jgi:uncharacterized protein (TIGR03067 family)